MLRPAWYGTAIPGLAIVLTVLSFSLPGERLNDALSRQGTKAGAALFFFPPAADDGPVLEVRSLRVALPRGADRPFALDSLDLAVRAGGIVCLVGESDSGKALAARGDHAPLPEPHGRVTGGTVRFVGQDPDTLSGRRVRALRGQRMAMIVQEPMIALNTGVLFITQDFGMVAGSAGRVPALRPPETRPFAAAPVAPGAQGILKTFAGRRSLLGARRRPVAAVQDVSVEPGRDTIDILAAGRRERRALRRDSRMAFQDRRPRSTRASGWSV